MSETLYGDKMQRKLFIKPYDRMIKDIVDEIEKGMIILDPDYQRNYVWKNDKASLLAESILLNIPIPPSCFLIISAGYYFTVMGKSHRGKIVSL